VGLKLVGEFFQFVRFLPKIATDNGFHS
jgi:hypothetical protein